MFIRNLITCLKVLRLFSEWLSHEWKLGRVPTANLSDLKISCHRQEHFHLREFVERHNPRQSQLAHQARPISLPGTRNRGKPTTRFPLEIIRRADISESRATRTEQSQVARQAPRVICWVRQKSTGKVKRKPGFQSRALINRRFSRRAAQGQLSEQSELSHQAPKPIC